MDSVYIHTVQYYETDKMGVVHHSNYIRFMEEARVHFLASVGWPYDRLEDMGLISPVVGVRCDYRRPARFADEIAVRVRVLAVTGAKLTIGYEMAVDGQLACSGESSHCFVTPEGRPVSLRKSCPELYTALCGMMDGNGSPGGGI